MWPGVSSEGHRVRKAQIESHQQKKDQAYDIPIFLQTRGTPYTTGQNWTNYFQTLAFGRKVEQFIAGHKDREREFGCQAENRL